MVEGGSPSRILRVLLISLGITILPKSSTRRTIPVAVPGVRLADGAAALHTDRGHSLRSLLPPPAALPSLPSCFHISFSFSAADKAPLCKGGWQKSLISDWGIVFCRYLTIPPSRLTPCHLSLHKGGFGAYNNFTNYAVSICKRQEIILSVSFTFSNHYAIMYGDYYLAFRGGILYGLCTVH